MPLRSSLITLTTDFGQSDPYVGQMKGAIFAMAPQMTVVDITHSVPPQDVVSASYLVGDLAPHFPAGTVHLAVIDPGVGSHRGILAVAAEDQFYIAPDNGLLTLILRRCPHARVMRVASPPASQHLSSTFHGRDWMAPAAAQLALEGVLGILSSTPEPSPHVDARIKLHAQMPPGSNRIDGEIVWIDHFGNLVTNIMGSVFETLHRPVRIDWGTRSILGIQRYYAEVAPDEWIALVGSTGRLEISMRNGNAARKSSASIGDPVVITSQFENERGPNSSEETAP